MDATEFSPNRVPTIPTNGRSILFITPTTGVEQILRIDALVTGMYAWAPDFVIPPQEIPDCKSPLSWQLMLLQLVDQPGTDGPICWS